MLQSFEGTVITKPVSTCTDSVCQDKHAFQVTVGNITFSDTPFSICVDLCFRAWTDRYTGGSCMLSLQLYRYSTRAHYIVHSQLLLKSALLHCNWWCVMASVPAEHHTVITVMLCTVHGMKVWTPWLEYYKRPSRIRQWHVRRLAYNSLFQDYKERIKQCIVPHVKVVWFHFLRTQTSTSSIGEGLLFCSRASHVRWGTRVPLTQTEHESINFFHLKKNLSQASHGPQSVQAPSLTPSTTCTCRASAPL